MNTINFTGPKLQNFVNNLLFRGMAYLKDFFEDEINLKNCFTKLFSSLKTSGGNIIKAITDIFYV